MTATGGSLEVLPAGAGKRNQWTRPGFLFGQLLTITWCGFVYLFLLAPLVVIAGASLHEGSAYAVMVFPPQEPTFKWYMEISEQLYDSLALSLGPRDTGGGGR